MSITKWSILGIMITLGGLSAGWGRPYGAVVAIGVVIVLIGDELIQAVKALAPEVPEEATETLAIDLSKVPSEQTYRTIFGEAN